MELIFLPVAAVLWIWYEENADNTSVFSYQGLFSSFSYSANEQMCRSWEGAQPDKWPSWAMEIFHTMEVMLS